MLFIYLSFFNILYIESKVEKKKYNNKSKRIFES